jgi:hypothetical protein
MITQKDLKERAKQQAKDCDAYQKILKKVKEAKEVCNKVGWNKEDQVVRGVDELIAQLERYSSLF